jgi:hypothetical protein
MRAAKDSLYNTHPAKKVKGISVRTSATFCSECADEGLDGEAGRKARALSVHIR